MKENKGITLIALVITIIVLLILAGVSLRLVAGNEGILNRAESAVSKSNTESLKEEIELAISELRIAYYEDKEEFSSADAYIRSKLNGKKIPSGTVELDGDNLKIDGAIIGTYTENGVTINNSTSKKSLVSQITAANYGDKVNYSVTIDRTSTYGPKTVLDDWRIFYKDEDKNEVIMIMNEFLPNAGSLAMEAGFQVQGKYMVHCDRRQDLITRLTESSNWADLLKGDKVDLSNKATAVGAIDLETWVASWNSNNGYTKLYTQKTTAPMNDGLYGYYVGLESTANSVEVNLENQTGYDNELYFSSKKSEDIQLSGSEWLSSPSAESEYQIVSIRKNDSSGVYRSYSNDYLGIRPAIYITDEVLGEFTNGAWNIE